MRRYQVLDRLFWSAITLNTVANCMFEPATMSYQIVERGGLFALISMIALGTFAIVATLDTIVNDVMKPRWTFKVGLRYRQSVWLLIAATFAGHAFVIVRTEEAWGIATFYTIVAFRAAMVSFADLSYEFQDRLPENRATDHGLLDA